MVASSELSDSFISLKNKNVKSLTTLNICEKSLGQIVLKINVSPAHPYKVVSHSNMSVKMSTSSCNNAESCA